MVKNINERQSALDPTNLFAFGNQLLLQANDNASGKELWQVTANQGMFAAESARQPEGNAGPSVYPFTITLDQAAESDRTLTWSVTGSGNQSR